MPKVYAAEIADGLGEVITSNASLAYLVPAKLIDAPHSTNKKISCQALAARANPDQPELFYLEDVLVSSVWNLNDDIFTPQVVWEARNTPEDKPFNLNHDDSEIIGHMTGSRVVNADGDVIADDTDVASLPSLIHVISEAVIYKHWQDAEYMKKIAGIIEEIKAGKWFVSMEALFEDYDYVIANEDLSEQHVVPRNEQTAFLSKYLRAYNGKGVYKNHRLGRQLKAVVFKGKGLVHEPANPDSKVFQTAGTATAKQIVRDLEITVAEKNMATDTTELDTLKAKFNAEVQAKVELDAKLIALKVQFDGVNAELAKVKAEFDKEKQKKEEEEEVYKKTKSKLEAVSQELVESKAEVAKFKADQTAAKRATDLMSKLKLEQKDAVSLAETLSGLSDEKFDSYVAKTSELVAVKEKAGVKEVVAGAEKEKAVASVTEEGDKAAETTRANINAYLTAGKKKENK